MPTVEILEKTHMKTEEGRAVPDCPMTSEQGWWGSSGFFHSSLDSLLQESPYTLPQPCMLSELDDILTNSVMPLCCKMALLLTTLCRGGLGSVDSSHAYL